MEKIQWHRPAPSLTPPGAFVRRRTLLKLFSKLSALTLDVRDAAAVREVEDGVEIVLTDSTAALRPLAVYRAGDQLGVKDALVNGLTPRINGEPINSQYPPLLDFNAGLLVIAIDVDAVALQQDGYRPVGGTLAPVRIGWDTDFAAASPVVNWGTAATGTIQGDGVLTTTDAGLWTIPLATVFADGSILQHLTVQSGTNLEIETGTRNW